MEIPERNDFRDYLFIVLYGISCVISLIGNGLVCKLVFTTAKMRTFTNILLGSMAVSDFICGLCYPFRLLCCWNVFIDQYGKDYCVTNKAVQLITFQMSSVVMCVIAIDRCVLFHTPFRKRDFSVWWPVGLSTVASILIVMGTSPSLAFQVYFRPSALVVCDIKKIFDPGEPHHLKERVCLAIANLAHFWVPLVIITVCYVKVSILVWNRRVGDMIVDVWMVQKWRSLKMLIAVVAVFFLSWFPFFIHNLVNFIKNSNQRRPCDQSYFFQLTVWLAFNSCCYNPIIYWWMNKEFRNGMNKIYSCNLNRLWTPPRLSESGSGQRPEMMHKGSSTAPFRISV